MLMLLPFQVTMVPNVLTLRALGAFEHRMGGHSAHMVLRPFYIFLVRQYMVGLPKEILEAAEVDGAGTLRCFLHVALPVCRPILGAAVALFLCRLLEPGGNSR